jgi:Spy/CpxP family protein refolding chaperone
MKSKKKTKIEDIPMTDEQYAQVKQEISKRKKLREIVKNNAKSQRGFGYEYKPIQFPEN